MPPNPFGEGRDEQMRRRLGRYGHLDFVRRILKPELSPRLGSMSHMMAAEFLGPREDVPAMFPTVVHDRRSGQLRQLTLQDAKQYAYDTGEFIPFDSIEQAIEFSKHYKRLWGSER